MFGQKSPCQSGSWKLLWVCRSAACGKTFGHMMLASDCGADCGAKPGISEVLGWGFTRKFNKINVLVVICVVKWERTRAIHAQKYPGRSRLPASPTHAACRSSRPSGRAGGRPGQEQAFLVSYHVSKVQGFCANNTRPCIFDTINFRCLSI